MAPVRLLFSEPRKTSDVSLFYQLFDIRWSPVVFKALSNSVEACSQLNVPQGSTVLLALVVPLFFSVVDGLLDAPFPINGPLFKFLLGPFFGAGI